MGFLVQKTVLVLIRACLKYSFCFVFVSCSTTQPNTLPYYNTPDFTSSGMTHNIGTFGGGILKFIESVMDIFQNPNSQAAVRKKAMTIPNPDTIMLSLANTIRKFANMQSRV